MTNRTARGGLATITFSVTVLDPNSRGVASATRQTYHSAQQTRRYWRGNTTGHTVKIKAEV